MITRLLVANRGEIARRVFATCRRLGIETVAVHSDADAGAPFVSEADVAVPLPGNAPADTYLRADLVLDAARRTCADAIHPGYGFLSENADFAQAVIDAGLTWVGPAPDSIRRMGSKIEAKALMAAAGVPVLTAPESPTETDLPLLVKASAGGGGRGMRIVRDLATLDLEIRAAGDEAASAFGDGTVFVEPYVEHGRHVEVQVLGHQDGILVLGERDCSVQRRHQKVIEECPAPGLSDATRQALHTAAAAAASAVDYRGAGTVEFLYDPDTERFFFLEMNTRLQVEHPVTELVHGVDLVELQLTVAEGRELDPRALGETYGHAVEARLYAEDPATDYQPQSGTLGLFEIPGVAAEFDLLNRPGLRVDSAFEGAGGSGSQVATYYDAMLAKVIAWAPTREQAVRRLADALAKARIHGLTTNRDQLVGVLTDPDFVAERLSTAFLDEHPVAAPVDTTEVPPAAVAAALAVAEVDRARRTVQHGVPVAWRNVPSQPQVTRFAGSSAPHSSLGERGADDPVIEVEWYGGRDGYVVDGLAVVTARPSAVTLEAGGVRTSYDVVVTEQTVYVDWSGGHASYRRVPRFTDPADAVASGSLLAPMPGTVTRVDVVQGDQVTAGHSVVVLEAMKMQHTVTAPHAGTVTQMSVQSGAQVAAGEVLAVVEPSSVEREPSSVEREPSSVEQEPSSVEREPSSVERSRDQDPNKEQE